MLFFSRSHIIHVFVSSGNFSFHHRVQNGSGAHPASYPMGIGGSFPGGKAAEREADHSSPSSAEVKNRWSYTSTSGARLHGVVLSDKHRDDFTLPLRSTGEIFV
jgi:hypothetical protein